jgi:hypothetical protein
MESHPSRARAPLGRWAKSRPQAAQRFAGLLTLALLVGCFGDPPARVVSIGAVRPPPDEIVVRTDRFLFHMGVKNDEAWATNSVKTRTSLGGALATLLDVEDIEIPILTRQLGMEWPSDAVDFDVALLPRGAESSGPCDPSRAGLPGRLEIAPGGEAPGPFFACVLERTFVRERDKSEIYRAILAGSSRSAEATALYACIVRVAVTALHVASEEGRKERETVERAAHLREACSQEALEWVSREWVKRVREDETARAFGARAAALVRRTASPGQAAP